MTTIFNRTPHDVVVITPKGVNDPWGRAATINPIDAEIVQTIPFEKGPDGRAAPANVRSKQIDAEALGDIPTVSLEYGQIDNLPAPVEGIYHIVSFQTVAAALDHGRPTWDLLTTAGAVRDASNPSRVVGCLALNRN
jgi:hypothetical protein